MIGYLTGEVVRTTEKSVLLDVNNVGFLVNINSRDAQRMPSRGSMVKIFTHMSVREDDISLFGFIDEEDLDVYKMLINISGVGPKAALSILSVLSAPELQMAVLADDAAAIAKAPGVGKKIAQKLILELKDRLDPEQVIGGRLAQGEKRSPAQWTNRCLRLPRR